MKLTFKKLNLPADQDRLKTFLLSEPWPFHVNTHLTAEKVFAMIREGLFEGTNYETYWILDDSHNEVGFLRLIELEDIEDGYPLFDLRIREKFRGKGIGKESVKWLTNYLFTSWPGLDRIAGTTRADNFPMRKTFRACGYVKEGHYRNDWPGPENQIFDTVKYAILREDWISGRSTLVHWHDE